MLGSASRGCAAICLAGSLSLLLAGCDANRNAGLAPLSAPRPSGEAIMLSPQLARLHDKSTAEVQAMVGSPDFRRLEPPGELWQYRSRECVVDLFFYGANDDRRVVHIDSRSRDPARVTEERCGDGSEVMKDRLRG
jgi:hypothetical protein